MRLGFFGAALPEKIGVFQARSKNGAGISKRIVPTRARTVGEPVGAGAVRVVRDPRRKALCRAVGFQLLVRPAAAPDFAEPSKGRSGAGGRGARQSSQRCSRRICSERQTQSCRL
jgi:hypothetical protein